MISITALVFAIFLGFALWLDNMIKLAFCRLFKIKVLGVGMLMHAGKPLMRKTVNGIDYSLGWYAGSYLKLHGLGLSKEEEAALPAAEKQYAFFTKPLYQRLVTLAASSLMWVVIFFAAIYFIDPSHAYPENLSRFGDLAGHSLRTMVWMESKETYIASVPAIVEGFKALPFATAALAPVFIYGTIWSNVTNIIGKHENKLLNTIGWILNIAGMLLVLWRLPSLFTSFYSFWELVKYLLHVMPGVLPSALVMYLITVQVARMRSKPQPAAATTGSGDEAGIY